METDTLYSNRLKSNARLAANFRDNNYQEETVSRKQAKLAEVSSILEFRPVRHSLEPWSGNEYLETAGKSYIHKELTLRGIIRVKNYSEDEFPGILFKVQTTAPEKFLVSPSIGFVPGKSTIETEVVNLPEVSFRSIPHEKFQVLVVQVPPETVLPPRESGKYKSNDLGKLWDKLCHSNCYVESFRLKPVLLAMESLIERSAGGKQFSGSGDSGGGVRPCFERAEYRKHQGKSGITKSGLIAHVKCMETVVSNLELNSKCNQNYVHKILCFAIMLLILSLLLLSLLYVNIKKCEWIADKGNEGEVSRGCLTKTGPDIAIDTNPWFPLM